MTAVASKRHLALTAALSALAVLLCATPGIAQSPTVVRGTTIQITSTTKPKRDRTLPYTFTTTGRIVPPGRYCTPNAKPTPGVSNCVPITCPAGVTDARYCDLPGRNVICSGVVNVRIEKRGATISTRNVRVRSDCSYRSSVSLRSRRRARTGNLSVRSRFRGNRVLLPRTSAMRTVHAG